MHVALQSLSLCPCASLDLIFASRTRCDRHYMADSMQLISLVQD